MRLHNLREGYKILPAIDKEKYQQRNGLEGPFSTLSGKVVYYDPKEGSYYDPDTDMYMTYDEFQNYDKDYSGMKDERDEVKEGGLRPSFAKELRNKELNKDKGPVPTGKTTGPDDYDFLKYKNKKKKETSEAVLDEAPSEVHTVYINGKKWKSFYKKESADQAAATIAARGKKTEVKSGPAPTYKAPAPTKAPEPKPQDPKQKAAMDKALKSIEMSFGPERKEITDQVLAMIRTAAMLNNPNWADRAWGNVEKYGIKDKADLVRELQMMIADEQKVKDDDLDGHIYGPDSNIKQMRKALDSIS
jgi:hypothetical protein